MERDKNSYVKLTEKELWTIIEIMNSYRNEQRDKIIAKRNIENGGEGYEGEWIGL